MKRATCATWPQPRPRIGRSSKQLSESSGQLRLQAACEKLSLQTANAPAAAAAARRIGVPRRRSRRRRCSGSGGGYFGGNVHYYDAQDDKDVAATNIRQLGRKTFFERGGRLVDSTVTADEEKSARRSNATAANTST